MAEDYKPNSHRSKEQELHEPMPEKRTEKVVTGNVKQRKKSGLAKAGSIFVPGDVESVKSYILMDVLVPSIKRAISDIVCNGVNMLLGEPSRGKAEAPVQRWPIASIIRIGTNGPATTAPERRRSTAMMILSSRPAATRKKCCIAWRSCWSALTW